MNEKSKIIINPSEIKFFLIIALLKLPDTFNPPSDSQRINTLINSHRLILYHFYNSNW